MQIDWYNGHKMVVVLLYVYNENYAYANFQN